MHVAPIRSIALAAALASTLAAPSWAQPAQQASETATVRASVPVPGQYLILFKQGVEDPEREGRDIAIQAGGQVLHHYRHAIKGVAVRVPEQAAAALENALRRNPKVESFEQDATVHINSTQKPVTWGLDRIDQEKLPLNDEYQYDYTGNLVHAFIIDTGIRRTHSEFGDRVLEGATAISDGRGTDDCNGHGTHVAGTVGGQTYGVAKGVTLVPVRVLNCNGSGTWSGVIAGIDWVAQQKKSNPDVKSAVGNMSLGGGYSGTVNAAVDGAVAAGVTMVVAASNENKNACNYSPASAPRAITVGATTSTDARASYSNYGSCLDLFAPGSGITSAWNTGDSATHTISGTSMATPHVTGVAALALAARSDASPAAVTQFLVDGSSKNVVSSAGTGSPNRLVYSLTEGVPPKEPTGSLGDLSTWSRRYSSSYWRAYAKVTITGLDNKPLSGIVVSGNFSGSSKSCTTAADGSCTLTSDYLSTRRTASTTFTVTGLGGFVDYDPAKNNPHLVMPAIILRP
jgi:aqualysin 1